MSATPARRGRGYPLELYSRLCVVWVGLGAFSGENGHHLDLHQKLETTQPGLYAGARRERIQPLGLVEGVVNRVACHYSRTQPYT